MTNLHYLQVSPPGSIFGSADATLNIDPLPKKFRGLILYKCNTSILGSCLKNVEAPVAP